MFFRKIMSLLIVVTMITLEIASTAMASQSTPGSSLQVWHYNDRGEAEMPNPSDSSTTLILDAVPEGALPKLPAVEYQLPSVVTGAEQMSLGTLGFIAGSHIECVQRAILSHDKLLYEDCVDQFRDMGQLVDLTVFSAIAQIPTSMMSLMIRNRSNMQIGRAALLSQVGLDFKTMIGGQIFGGAGMIAGSLGQHFFHKARTSKEYAEWIKARTERAYWKDRKLEMEDVVASARGVLGNPKLTQKQKFDSVRATVVQYHQILLYAVTDQKPEEVLSTLYSVPDDIDKLVKIKDICDKKVLAASNRVSANLDAIWTKTKAVDNKELNELEISTSEMVVTTMIMASAMLIAKTMVREVGYKGARVASHYISLEELFNSLTPRESGIIYNSFRHTLNSQDLVSVDPEHFHALKFEAFEAKFNQLNAREQEQMLSKVLKDRFSKQFAESLKQNGSKILPKWVIKTGKTVSKKFEMSYADQVFYGGRDPVILIDSEHVGAKLVLGKQSWKEAVKDLTSGRKNFLRVNKWLWITAASAVMGYTFLSVNSAVRDTRVEFGYEHTLPNLYIPIFTRAGITKFNLTDEQTAMDFGLMKLNDRIELVSKKVTAASVDAVAGKAPANMSEVVQGGGLGDMSEDEIKALPPAYIGFLEKLGEFDQVFKSHINDMVLMKFNKHFSVFEKKFNDEEESKRKINQYLRWFNRGTKESDAGFLYNGNTNPEDAARYVDLMYLSTSPLFGEEPGKVWHVDPKVNNGMYRGTFEEEKQSMLEEFKTKEFAVADINAANLKFNFPRNRQSKHSLPPGSSYDDFIKVNDLVVSQTEKENNDTFKTFMVDDINLILPDGRDKKNARHVQPGPVEKDLEYEFTYLRRVVITLADYSQKNLGKVTPLLDLLVNSSKSADKADQVSQALTLSNPTGGAGILYPSPFDSAFFPMTKDTFEPLAEKFNAAQITAAFRGTPEDRVNALTIEIYVAIKNLSIRALTLQSMKKFIIDMNLQALSKCGKLNDLALLKNSRIKEDAGSIASKHDNNSNAQGCFDQY